MPGPVWKAPRPPRPQPPQKEGKDWFWPILGAIFAVGAVVALAYMVANAPRMKPLVCKPPARPSLTRWGSCKAE